MKKFIIGYLIIWAIEIMFILMVFGTLCFIRFDFDVPIMIINLEDFPMLVRLGLIFNLFVNILTYKDSYKLLYNKQENEK